MKRITAIALFFTAGFIPVSAALAAAHTVEAKVPFDFIVHNQVLPAGTYRITPLGGNVLVIGTKDKPAMEASTIYAHSSLAAKDDGKLVFKKYGNQYFLREILCDSALINASLPTSKLEKRIQSREEAQLNMNQPNIAAVR
ncbi:MAG: hypothetical protein ACJ71S_10420 [Acidobacteriaceae bacterium]